MYFEPNLKIMLIFLSRVVFHYDLVHFEILFVFEVETIR